MKKAYSIVSAMLLTITISCGQQPQKENSASIEILSETEAKQLTDQAYQELFGSLSKINLGTQTAIKEDLEFAVFETNSQRFNGVNSANSVALLLETSKTEGATFNTEESFFETLTPDELPNTPPNPPEANAFKKITVPIETARGTVSIDFGTSASDAKNADQEVDPLLVSSLKKVIEETNENLFQLNVPLITSIYIMCTTNGKHSPNSNHSRGTAVDISRINGVKIINHKYSLLLFMFDYQRLITTDPKISADVTNNDLLYLYQRTMHLQASIQNLGVRRENFGPIMKTKFYKSSQNNSYDYNVGGHLDHIHFSVR